VLYPEVLTRLAELAGQDATAAQLQAALDASLTRVRLLHRQLTWNRWTTAVLAPDSG
jgi:hypothetical protein